MKIAMLYASWEDFGEPWSTPQGIRNELMTRGHDVRHYNLYHDNGRLPSDNMRRYSNQGINQLYSDFTNHRFVPDLILSMDYGPWDALQFDKRYFPGVVLLKEAGDEPQSHRQHWNAGHRVHGVLSPDKQCVERYHQAGINAAYWTHHADTRLFQPSATNEKYDCVTTCGPRGQGITEEIKSVLGDSFNNERYFYGQDHADRLNMGKMVFQCSQFKEVTRRIFEGMACGKLVITDRLPEATGLSEMFIEDEDIIYYDTADEAIDKIQYYAKNDVVRSRLAASGHKKVMSHHTQVQRCDDIERLVEEVRND